MKAMRKTALSREVRSGRRALSMVAASDRQDDSLRREFNPPSGHFESVGGNSPIRGK